ncbi:MAG TPA: proline/glycine betaine ABC transporter permease [Spirochaetota bacterium]|nr:proline/glycine betaine ABC transporter permease [Spirochaetota bacterium]HPQ54205.1 proline/glycine betaine ABC transporter permease [Spirochaetota bacterium]
MITIPKFPLGEGIEYGINYLTDNFAFITKAVSAVVETGIEGLNQGLMYISSFSPLILIAVITVVAWLVSTRRIAIGSFLGLLFIWNLGLWEATVSTFSLVLISTLISVMMGLPLGILAAFYERFYKVVMPVLDFMQTMPAFVYLIPAIPFFGLGPVSAVFTTVIFSMPPAIRLTCLGIRQVPFDLIEAADAFGASRMQKLYKIQLPVATPTIMAGVNQTIMLALSMVVIAAMIGAGGLGGEVWRAIQRLKPGMGFEAGIAVVIMAIILDRITQNIKSKQ